MNKEIFKSMKKNMQPDERLKEQLYEKLESGGFSPETSTAVKPAPSINKWLPMLSAACILIIAVAIVYPIVRRDGEYIAGSSSGKKTTEETTCEFCEFWDSHDMCIARTETFIPDETEISEPPDNPPEDVLSCSEDIMFRKYIEYKKLSGEATYPADWWDHVAPEMLTVHKNFGHYSGLDVMTIILKNMSLDGEGVYIEVAGYKFFYLFSLEIVTYDLAEFNDIQTAYETGLLTKKDIAGIYEMHFKDCLMSSAPDDHAEYTSAENNNSETPPDFPPDYPETPSAAGIVDIPEIEFTKQELMDNTSYYFAHDLINPSGNGDIMFHVKDLEYFEEFADFFFALDFNNTISLPGLFETETESYYIYTHGDNIISGDKKINFAFGTDGKNYYIEPSVDGGGYPNIVYSSIALTKQQYVQLKEWVKPVIDSKVDYSGKIIR